MKTQSKPSIPLKLEVKYDETEDLLDLATDEEFSTFILENAIIALKQAIRKNKSECVLFELVNYDFKVLIKKPKYKSLLNAAIKHYEKLEDYTKCSELVNLKSRL